MHRERIKRSGTQLGYHDQPVWYGGLLYVFNMGQYEMRADLDNKTPIEETFKQFDAAAAHFAATRLDQHVSSDGACAHGV